LAPKGYIQGETISGARAPGIDEKDKMEG